MFAWECVLFVALEFVMLFLEHGRGLLLSLSLTMRKAIVYSRLDSLICEWTCVQLVLRVVRYIPKDICLIASEGTPEALFPVNKERATTFWNQSSPRQPLYIWGPSESLSQFLILNVLNSIFTSSGESLILGAAFERSRANLRPFIFANSYISCSHLIRCR